jgi:putative transposase
MKKRITEEQIIAVLKEAEAGSATKKLCRRHGISEGTFYNWKAVSSTADSKSAWD